jgi:molecular chaperone DnaK (HSP70)
LTVSEVATRQIRRVVQSASDYLGKQVTAAVFTVPTNFTDAQKEALVAAAKAADLEVLQTISEPVAAVLAYDARPESKVADKIVVVADLGGTRSDVALIASRDGMYTVLATSHDYEFAGAQLDQVLIDHFSKEFIKKHKSDPRENAKSLAKLKYECEAAKKALSQGASANLSIESLADGIDYASTVTRSRYEMLASKVFGGITRLIEGVVAKADRDVLDVDEVILSGGTSHTPKIARNLASVFAETTTILAPSTLATAINPSELLTRGAAIQASLIQEYDTEDIEQSTHDMVTVNTHLSNAIGVVLGEGSFAPIFVAETAIPARRTAQFPAPKEGGDVLIKIVEGTRHIKVTKAEPKEKTEKDEDDSDFDDDDDEEDEDLREREWHVGKLIAEVAIKGVKKGGKIEVGINVAGDLGINVTAREVGSKGGVRGQVPAPSS